MRNIILSIIFIFFSTFTIGSVTLYSFDISLVYTNKLQVDWVSSQENNHSVYVIERSVDNVNFYTSTSVQGAGTSYSLIHYRTFVTEPTYNTVWIRLRMTDINGFSTYSAAKFVNNYPPPASVPPGNLIDNGDFEFHSSSFTDVIHYEQDGCGIGCFPYHEYVYNWWSDAFGFNVPACLQNSSSPAGPFYARLVSRKDDNINQGSNWVPYNGSWTQEMWARGDFKAGRQYKLYFWVKTSSAYPLSKYNTPLKLNH
ncbi:MAG: hypothetical protein K2X86_01435 [Cytophagaceae bacterium]|nr:hypothetical protein [Cytophagaceae bacterium]